VDETIKGIKDMSDSFVKGFVKGFVQTTFFPAANLWEAVETAVPAVRKQSNKARVGIDCSVGKDEYVKGQRKTYKTLSKGPRVDPKVQEKWDAADGARYVAYCRSGGAKSSFLGITTDVVGDMFVKNLKGWAFVANPWGAITLFSSQESPEKNEAGSEVEERAPTVGKPVEPSGKTVTDESIEIDGKKYAVKVFENGEIIINGKAWHLHGAGVTIDMNKFHFNSETQEVEIKAEGSISFYRKKIHKFFSKDQIKKILRHMVSSEKPLKLISIKAPLGVEYPITLEPGPHPA